jgi:hypothetical protein
MREIPREEVIARMRVENPWWGESASVGSVFSTWRPRAYLNLFFPLLMKLEVRRAILLMGPRRVGKTVLIHHAVQRLIKEGTDPKTICYVSVDHPIYNGCGLDDLLGHYREASGIDTHSQRSFVFFDEIQYLKNWETHLKSLVDSYPNLRFTASGSAAAALRLKSNESGAGRFTDFLLPPLTFHEYLDLLGKNDLFEPDLFTTRLRGTRLRVVRDIDELNNHFVHYLNYGGYPEAIFSEAIQADPQRFIKSDIIDKVLLRDLPSLYGVQDIQELNHLFTTLAYNTAGEVSLEKLAKSSGVAKNTIKRYIEYLEAAFLVKTVHRIDRNGKRFQRATFFKVYLTNPSIRSALFAPVKANDNEVMGHLAETGIFSQWFHHPRERHYARWHDGEVDIVGLSNRQKVLWAVEVKWSDRIADSDRELQNVISFCKANHLEYALMTTRTFQSTRAVDGIQVEFVPASLYCYTLGYNIIRGRAQESAKTPGGHATAT